MVAWTVNTVPALRRATAQLRKPGHSVALVPTMGALHEGHLSLIRLARDRAKLVIVSIFVNPAQFAPNEDFASYPRSFDADLAALTHAGVDLVWAPPQEVMYPAGFATRVSLKGPATVGLEDAFRPHFFDGVGTVVTKLLIQCAPDFALFGEKDFQQLRVVQRLVADLALPVEIVAAPTVRENDGLAMSSRNSSLSCEERAAAPSLYRLLMTSAGRIAQGEPIAPVLDEGGAELKRAGFQLDYLEARHAESLEKIASVRAGPLRLLVAARIGRTRLIDNVSVGNTDKP